MVKETFIKLKEKKYIIQGFIIFSIFLVIYTLLDTFNGGYSEMRQNFGLFLVFINIFFNILMSFLSALMMNLSTAYMSFSKKEGKGTLFTAISVLFGMMTYGCTPCVIAFFATIGISLSVAILPLGGLPYKLISLVILLAGLAWLLYEIKRFRCKISITTEE